MHRVLHTDIFMVMVYFSPMKKQSKNNKEIVNEKPTKIGKNTVSFDKKDAEELEGAPVGKAKTKKAGVVAIKHKKVLDTLVKENLGKSRKSEYQALIDEGYSHSYARSGQIKKTKAWETLTAERFHDDKLSNIHAQLIVAKKIDYMLFTHEIPDQDIYELLESVGCTPKKIVHGVAGTHVWFWAPDNKSRKDAIELAYKVRGKLAPETIKLERTGLQGMTDQELADLIKAQKKFFLKKD